MLCVTVMRGCAMLWMHANNVGLVGTVFLGGYVRT